MQALTGFLVLIHKFLVMDDGESEVYYGTNSHLEYITAKSDSLQRAFVLLRIKYNAEFFRLFPSSPTLNLAVIHKF